mmetsp:Transcript_20406/g.33668  ORF Transcript_20406/g.33668 Transcript_20406/m.33668 type:complete len:673 (-) Transcript_20406:2495-4513(-)|eukprot:CAMPEP_0203757450 /NCGR_PEP_ID=MMETSP0098-20131031/10509_1 /ASSEMBLY_ACC=CAM_ASM_000208 /TAXON_ID=96639 /ORGANISM=" , Strain NY0313808BC1" /LENGTH=672 /DNA_ID=CAMNT_0050649661 /DNA_START=300 /DNA_END=2318 /DNA_ORIENTATION=+
MGEDDVFMEGILRKRVPYFRMYQKFFVVLRGGRLDLFHEKTRELMSSIILSEGFTLTELSRTHKNTIGGKSAEACAFSIFNEDVLIARFMADTTSLAQEWRDAVQKAIKDVSKRPRSIRRKRGSEHRGQQPGYISEKAQVAQKVEFEFLDNVSGLTVYKETNMTQKNVLLKCGCVIEGGADEVFDLILSDSVNDAAFDEWEERMEILEEHDDKHLRVEHVRWYPVKVMGLWTKARDFVLQRYWMSLENGTKMITWRSCTHPKAPVDPNYVRANIWMTGFLITPQKKTGANGQESCWVDFCIHFSPEGWLNHMPFVFHERWAYPLITRLTLLRDAVVRRRYVDVDYSMLFRKLQTGGMARKTSSRNVLRQQSSKRITGGRRKSSKKIVPPPKPDSGAAASPEAEEEKEEIEGIRGSWDYWVPIPLDKEPLMVRGKHYLSDKKKVECRKSAFEVVAMDLFETEGRVTHIASRPDSLVHRLVKEAGHPFIFLVHFTLPGPPFYSLVVYFAAKPEDMTVDNPFGDLLNKFLNTSQEFRDGCFKFIPRVVKGNFIVRKSVGTTPAILGKKLDQEYYGDGETYFEVVVDVGSSSIAGTILGVVKGYATSLQIDLAFLLEGQTNEFLPEQILGGVRLVHPVIDAAVKLPFYALPEAISEAEDDEEPSSGAKNEEKTLDQ